jgi:UDP-N-acetylmuramate--alanine ligase
MFLENKHLHFIGIAGCGMLPLARVFKNYGYKITGSDKNTNKINLLKKEGFKVSDQQTGNFLHTHPRVIYSSAIAQNNPELIQAKKLKLQLLHRSDLLESLLKKNKNNLIVCGSHGKTTTTALTSHLLTQHQLPTLAIIGGDNSCSNIPSSQHSNYLIAEADESDGSITKYHPKHCIINNVDIDHPDYYTSYELLFNTYKKLISQINPKGYLIYNYDNQGSQKVGKLFPGKKLSFGLSKSADLYASNYTFSSTKTSFNINYQGQIYPCTTPLLGVHNILNSLASIAAGICFNLHPKESSLLLKDFRGVKRRMELLHHNTQKNFYLYDDYAHNPEKISSALSALKKSFPKHRLEVVFQPHRYSRIKGLYQGFVQAFKNADKVYLTPFCSAGEDPDDDLSLEKLSSAIASYSLVNTTISTDFNNLCKYISQQNLTNCIIITLGAGDIYKVAYQIKEQHCAERFFKKKENSLHTKNQEE